MKTHPDRTPPAELIYLVRLAIRQGLDTVSLHFESLGADFPAPIGWMVNLDRYDPAYVNHLNSSGQSECISCNHLTIMTQINSEISGFTGEGTDISQWGIKEIREWILADRPQVDTPDDDAEIAWQVDAMQMTTAWKLGWNAKRSIQRMAGDRIYTEYTFEADNYFYNVVEHPAHRDTGTKVSEMMMLSKEGYSGEWVYAAIDDLDEYNRPTQIDPHAALDRLTQHPPWHAQVAYFDDELEDWIL